MFSKKKTEAETPAEPSGGDDNAIAPADGEDLATVQKTNTEDIVYPKGLKLALIMTSIFVTMFIVALDRLITATAIPQITDDFHSVTDIGWYGSAYLLTICAFQLLYGKIYSVYSIKVTILVAILLFEIGSAVSGAAPTSVAFIIGRAIAGIGGAGIQVGAISIIVHSVPLHRRSLFQGMFGAVFAIASICGPLLGGAFTSNVTWRWCFYINLPLGGVAMVAILFLLKIPDREETKIPTKAKLAQMDFYGTALIMPASICLILALEWGGLTYPWSDGRIIALLVLAVVLGIGFSAVQIFLPNTATIPPRVFAQRSILAASFSALCTGSHMMIFFYYLPIWFQSIQGVSAVQSGIRILPLLLSMVVGTLSSGAIIHRIGYYTPFMIIGVCLMSIGAGLFNTLEVGSSEGHWIGYQIVYGLGMGFTVQAPNLAAQTVLPRRDVPIGTSLMFFVQLLGGAVFVSVGQNVLDNQLAQRLSSIPGFTPEVIRNSGATSLTNMPGLSEATKRTVLIEYNLSIRRVFLVGLILSCLSVFGALGMEWRSMKQDVKKEKKDEEQGTEKVAEAADNGAGEKTPHTDDEKASRTEEARSGQTTPVNAEEKADHISTEKKEHEAEKETSG